MGARGEMVSLGLITLQKIRKPTVIPSLIQNWGRKRASI
jgi:hypothetical protein